MDEIASPHSEADSPEAQSAPSGSAKGPVRAYSSAVLAERQPRVSDLIPIRPFAALFLVLAGLTGIAAIETIYIHLATIPLGSAAESLAALDVNQPGCLAACYSALLLALAAAASLAVFGIRAHRVDDYRGRYRIWLWAAAAFGWASLDAATGLHSAIGWALSMAAGQPADSNSATTAMTLAWLGLYTLVFGTLAVRAAIEVWTSLPSFASLAVAGLLYLMAAMMQFGMLQAVSPLVNSVAASTVLMLAHLALTSAVVLYARHVHLDAQGRLKVHIDPDRKKGKKAKSKARLKVVKEDRSDDNEPAEKPAARPAPSSEPAKPATQPRFGWGASSSGSNSSGNQPAKISAATSKSASSSDDDSDQDDEDEDDSYGGQKLSRAERKRLKKLARRDQQQRRAA